MSKVVIGSDHAGVALRKELAGHLADLGWEVSDVGLPEGQSVDYPVQAEQVARTVGSGEADLGVVVCGTGIGVSIAANKVRGIRAALITDPYTGSMAREHNDANVVCFGARVTGAGVALAALDAFLAATPSRVERHVRRVEGIGEIEDRP